MRNLNGKDKAVLQGKYSGLRDDMGKPHGLGKVEHSLACTMYKSTQLVVVEGEWTHGQLHGFAKFTMNGHVIYDGQWNQNWMMLQVIEDIENSADGTTAKAIDTSPAIVNIATTIPSDINNISMMQLELMWRYCSAYCGTSDITAADMVASDGIKPPVISNPMGPTDFLGFARLVLIWSLCGATFFLIMAG